MLVVGEPEAEDELAADEADGELELPADGLLVDGLVLPSGLEGDEGLEGEPGLPSPLGVPGVELFASTGAFGGSGRASRGSSVTLAGFSRGDVPVGAVRAWKNCTSRLDLDGRYEGIGVGCWVGNVARRSGGGGG
ncbi:hypothetical protein KXD97_08060 [Mycobacterium sp. SMC-8]|uniref:hypothetical protein n=1 Tax=Mycobacterium sp. SMC-8 TaxID=2857060 RepID=UPI0021B48DAD|nr:hypothetical protein [Mycobacterium sp. SMC-8]UXA13724.1 hypothetical protein KXD97_08060 [Mycobacterium sp. SMC-8]